MTPLAHGSGADEAIIVLLPLAIVVVMLRMGAKKMPPEDTDPAAGPSGGSGDPPASGGPTDSGEPPAPGGPAGPGGPADRRPG